jgi:hypothetical protein
VKIPGDRSSWKVLHRVDAEQRPIGGSTQNTTGAVARAGLQQSQFGICGKLIVIECRRSDDERGR